MGRPPDRQARHPWRAPAFPSSRRPPESGPPRLPPDPGKSPPPRERAWRAESSPFPLPASGQRERPQRAWARTSAPCWRSGRRAPPCEARPIRLPESPSGPSSSSRPRRNSPPGSRSPWRQSPRSRSSARRESSRTVSAPMVFILEWNSRQTTPSPKVDEACAGILLDFLLAGFERRQQQDARLIFDDRGTRRSRNRSS